MDTLGVLSLLPSCPGWWLLIGHTASDATVMAAVSVLCGRGGRCCCESPGGVAWYPTYPMRLALEWWAACCYRGDRSTPPTICTTRLLLRLQGSLEEAVIKTQHSSHADSRSAADRFYHLSDEGPQSPRWEIPPRCPRNDPLRPLTRATRGITCSLYGDYLSTYLKESLSPLSDSVGEFLEEPSVEWTVKDTLGTLWANGSLSSGYFPICSSDSTGELLS